MARSIETSLTGFRLLLSVLNTSGKKRMSDSMMLACFPHSVQSVSLLGGLMRLGAQTMARFLEVIPVTYNYKRELEGEGETWLLTKLKL